jgi:predicted nucleic-acid-binding Zn-ribbon protein
MNINIISENVPTSFDVVCSKCDFTGTATVEIAKNIKEISSGEGIKFDGAKCPKCKYGDIYGISGKYKRNDQTNHMDRIGDYE